MKPRFLRALEGVARHRFGIALALLVAALSGGGALLAQVTLDGLSQVPTYPLPDPGVVTQNLMMTQGGQPYKINPLQLAAPFNGNCANLTAPFVNELCWNTTTTPASLEVYQSGAWSLFPNFTPYAPLASPALTGIPTAPTAPQGTNTTQLATTAFVAGAGYAPLASPALTGTPTAPTAAAGTATTQIATTAFVADATRLPLMGATVFYVAPTGSDTNNNCTVSASPCATIQHAYTVIAQDYDTRGNNVTIQLADGTYTSGLNINGPLVGQNQGGTLILQGNTSQPQNTIIDISGGTGEKNFNANNDAVAEVSYVTLKNTSASPFNFCISIGNGATVYLQNITYAGCGGADIAVAFHGTAYVLPGSQAIISASVAEHFQAYWGSVITGCGSPGGCSITLENTPNFSGAFAFSYGNSIITASGITFTGTATGTRYSANENSSIDANAAGANYFPGNAAGTPSTTCTESTTGGYYC